MVGRGTKLTDRKLNVMQEMIESYVTGRWRVDEVAGCDLKIDEVAGNGRKMMKWQEVAGNLMSGSLSGHC